MNLTVECSRPARKVVAGLMVAIACSCAAAPGAATLRDARAHTSASSSICAATDQRRLFGGMNTMCMRAGEHDQLFCWGANLDGTLSLSNQDELEDCRLEGGTRPVPCARRPLAIGIEHVRDVAIGLTNCALDSNGVVMCWGLRGALMGDTANSRVELPWHMVVDELKGVQRVVTWRNQVFGARPDGSVECLDLNDPGAPKTCSARDNPFITLGQPVQQLGSSRLSLCALARDGRVFCTDVEGPGPDCWAGGCVGPLREVSRLRAQSISLDMTGACALDADGSVWCWGADGLSGGPSAADPQRFPGLPRIQRLAGGAGHGCASSLDGNLYCWGAHSAESRIAAHGNNKPEPIEGMASLCELAGGLFHMCAVTASNKVICWGGNQYGQLGDGSHADRPKRAAPVLPPATGPAAASGEGAP
jgi:alpha-tubulin suppressor-like RCC1 family protein